MCVVEGVANRFCPSFNGEKKKQAGLAGRKSAAHSRQCGHETTGLGEQDSSVYPPAIQP